MIKAVLIQSYTLTFQDVINQHFGDYYVHHVNTLRDVWVCKKIDYEIKKVVIALHGDLHDTAIDLFNSIMASEEGYPDDRYIFGRQSSPNLDIVVLSFNPLFLNSGEFTYPAVAYVNVNGIFDVMGIERIQQWQQKYSLFELHRMSQLNPIPEQWREEFNPLLDRWDSHPFQA